MIEDISKTRIQAKPDILNSMNTSEIKVWFNNIFKYAKAFKKILHELFVRNLSVCFLTVAYKEDCC